MAPTKPSARTLRTQRLTGQIHPLAPLKTFRPEASTSDSFISSKLDKRLIKHSSFLSRVTSSSSSSRNQSSSSSRISKPRRRNNKNATTQQGINNSLSILADALPELEEDQHLPPDGKIHHKSLKSKKGALKRKERIVKGEMERFGASMAQLHTVNSLPATIQQQQQRQQQQQQQHQQQQQQNYNNNDNANAATTNRWAALRGFISATMKQNPAFENQ